MNCQTVLERSQNYAVAYGMPGKGPIFGPGEYHNAFAMSHEMLMTIRNNGALWRVIGRIVEGADQIHLPGVRYEKTQYKDSYGLDYERRAVLEDPLVN